MFQPAGHTPIQPTDLSFLSLNLKSVTNLGMKIDSGLKMDAWVNAKVKSCFLFHFRRLAKLKSILCRRHLESVIQAFITSRLDTFLRILLKLPWPLSRCKIQQLDF